MQSKLSERLPIVALGLAFAVSSGASLVYVVSWACLVTRVLGNPTHAVATVLAAALAGLALGSYALSKLDRPRLRSLGGYAALEAVVGALGFLSPVLLRGLDAVSPRLQAASGGAGALLVLATFGALLLPSTFMGASVALLASRFGRDTRALGAALGCALAGFVLIEAHGLTTTVRCAVGANLVVAAAAAALAWRGAPLVASPGEPAPAARALVLAALASGAAAGLLVNGWARALALVLGAVTDSFPVLLTTVLAGLTLGGLVARRRASRLTDLSFVLAAVALTTLGTVPLLGRLPEAFVALLAARPSAEESVTPALVAAALVLIVPAGFLGASLSLFARLGATAGRAGEAALAASALGAALGGFVVLPLAGGQRTIELAALVFAASAVALLALERARAPRRRAVAALAVSVACVAGLRASGRWDERVLTAGVFARARDLPSLGTRSLRRAWFEREDVVFYREGPSGAVSVHARPGRDHATLRVNGRTVASSSEARTPLLLGYVPALLAPACSRVLVIGLGSGVTAHAFAAFPALTRLEVVAGEPGAVEAAAFFARANGKVLEDARVQVRAGDARRLLAQPEPAFDVIAGGPALATEEAYREILARLTPDGLFAQSLPLEGLPPEDVQAVGRTFAAVFPEASLWRTGPSDLLLIGSRRPLALRAAEVAQRLASSAVARADLAALGLEGALGLAPLHLLDGAGLAAFVGKGRTLSDDAPRLESASARAIGRPTEAITNALLVPHISGVFCPDVNPATEPTGRAALELASGSASLGDLDVAAGWIDRSLECDPNRLEARLLRCRVDVRAGREERAVASVDDLLQGGAPETIETALEVARALPAERALPLVTRVLEKAPKHLAARLLRGRLLFDTGQPEAAGACHRETSELFPASGEALEGVARSALWRNDFEEAIRCALRALAAGPLPGETVADVHALLGTACWKLARDDEAIEHFHQALRAGGRFGDGRLRLAACLARRARPGDRAEAVQVLRDLLALEPDNVEAWQRLLELGAPL